MEQRIPLAKPFFGEEEVEVVREILKSGWVAQGPNVAEFEKEFAAYCGAKYGVAVNSCTSGLHLSLLSCELGIEDTIIIPDFTYMATGNVVLNIGAIPKIIDIENQNYQINIEKLEENIDDTVKAIIPVHPFGYPLDMDKINTIAKKFNLIVIEDAALGVGSMRDKKKVGSFGNISCFSLQGRKVITTGEGGMIVTNNEEHYENLLSLRNQGSSRKNNNNFNSYFKRVGFSYRLSDIQAGIGRVQLSRIESFIKHRIEIAKIYHDLFIDLRLNVKYPKPSKNIRFNYQTYIIEIPGNNRNEIIKQMKSKGIETTIGTYSLSSQPMFGHINKKYSYSEFSYNHTLALPMYHEMESGQVEYVVKSLKEII